LLNNMKQLFMSLVDLSSVIDLLKTKYPKSTNFCHNNISMINVNQNSLDK